jgi:hypothetical protein
MPRSTKGKEEETEAVMGRVGTTGEALGKPAGGWLARKEEQPERRQ